MVPFTEVRNTDTGQVRVCVGGRHQVEVKERIKN